MAYTKAKMIGIAAAAVLLGGLTTVVVKQRQNFENPSGNDSVSVLRAQLAAAGGTPEQIDNLVCVDNLKQIGAALSRQAEVPADLLALKNQLDTPLRLHCPKDVAKKAPRRWSDFRALDISYVFTPNTPTIARCPIHSHILLPDGRVIQGSLMQKTK